MKSMILSLLLVGVMTAQLPRLQSRESSLDKLTATLQSLSNNSVDTSYLSDQLADHMMALANPGDPPSRSTVMGFTTALTGTLNGKSLTAGDVVGLRRAITDIVSGSGAIVLPASRLRETLTALRVDPSKTQTIIKHYIAIGEQVRGPDDSRVLRFLKK